MFSVWILQKRLHLVSVVQLVSVRDIFDVYWFLLKAFQKEGKALNLYSTGTHCHLNIYSAVRLLSLSAPLKKVRTLVL